MKIYNYIKHDICEPIAAENRKEADLMFISGFKVETDEIKKEITTATSINLDNKKIKAFSQFLSKL